MGPPSGVDAAERAGAASGSVTDIHLPAWFPRDLPAIPVALLVLIGWLHRRGPRPGRAGKRGA